MVATLRGNIQNKFKRKSTGGNLQEILQRTQFQKKKSVLSDSENENAPEFDCSAGLHLSDSSDSEAEGGSKQKRTTKATTSSLVGSINQASSATTLDLKAVHDNYQKMEKAKAQLAAYKSAGTSSQKENLNIADLLAMGEGSSASKEKKSKRVHKDDSDDDGWEEVEGKRIKIPRYMKTLKKFKYDG